MVTGQKNNIHHSQPRLTFSPVPLGKIFSLITRLYFIPRGAIEANFITKFSICRHVLVLEERRGKIG